MIQEPVVVLDHMAAMLPAAIFDGACPCVGHTLLYGMAYSDAAVTITISQGINDKAGTLQYRHHVVIAVAAGVAQVFQVPISGKFIRTRVQNTGPGLANVEVFTAIRSYE